MWDLRLALLEGRFSKTMNLMRKPVVDFMSDALTGTPHGYYHEALPDKEALPVLIRRLGARRDMRWLYVASHGSRGGVYAGNGEVTPTAAIAGALESDGFEGAFFSACRFGTLANARRLLLRPGTSLKWMAGYTEEFDWVHGTAIELFFWYAFLGYEAADSIELLCSCAERLDQYMPGAHREAGLQIYLRVGRKIETLLGRVDHDRGELVVAQPTSSQNLPAEQLDHIA